MKNIKRIISTLLAIAVIITVTPGTGLTPAYAKNSKLVMYPKDTEQLAYKKGTKYKSSNKKIATVTKKGLIKAKKKGSVRIIITSGGKKKIRIITVKKAPAVTRGAWIKQLVNDSEVELSSAKCRYKDVSGAYKKSVMTAYESGAIPGKSKYFHPYRPATREFMSYSAVHIMGFQMDSTASVNCTDSSDLKYVAEDAVSLRQGFVKLKNDKFLPSSMATHKDMTTALEAVSSIITAEKVIPGHQDDVELRDDVNDSLVNKGENYQIEESGDIYKATIPSNKDTEDIQKGDVVFIPDNNNSVMAIKATDVQNEGSDITISGIQPEMSEIYKKVDINKETTADLSGFDANDNIVNSAVPVKSGTSSMYNRVDISLNDSFAIGSDINKEESFALGDTGSLDTKFTIYAPKITTIIDIENPLKFEEYKQVTMYVSQRANVDLGIKIKDNLGENTKLELGTCEVPIEDSPLSAKLTFYLNIGIGGAASVTCDIATKTGMSYIKGNLRFIGENDINFDKSDIEVSGHAYFEPHVDMLLYACVAVPVGATLMFIRVNNIPPVTLSGLYADVGPGFSASVTKHNSAPKECVNVDLYLYLSVSINTDKGVGKFIHDTLPNVPVSETILDNKKENKVRKQWHYEDGKRTYRDKCTWDRRAEENTDDGNSSDDVRDYTEYPTGELLGINLYKLNTSIHSKADSDSYHNNNFGFVAPADGYGWVTIDKKMDSYVTYEASVDEYDIEDGELVRMSSYTDADKKNVRFSMTKGQVYKVDIFCTNRGRECFFTCHFVEADDWEHEPNDIFEPYEDYHFKGPDLIKSEKTYHGAVTQFEHDIYKIEINEDSRIEFKFTPGNNSNKFRWMFSLNYYGDDQLGEGKDALYRRAHIDNNGDYVVEWKDYDTNSECGLYDGYYYTLPLTGKLSKDDDYYDDYKEDHMICRLAPGTYYLYLLNRGGSADTMNYSFSYRYL